MKSSCLFETKKIIQEKKIKKSRKHVRPKKYMRRIRKKAYRKALQDGARHEFQTYSPGGPQKDGKND